MKRLYTCIGIVAAIIIMSSVSLSVIRKSNNELNELIDRTAQAYSENGDTERALEELQNCWGKYYKKISYIAKTDMLNDIASVVRRLPQLLESDSDEFLPELESVKTKTELIYSSQRPSLHSIF